MQSRCFLDMNGMVSEPTLAESIAIHCHGSKMSRFGIDFSLKKLPTELRHGQGVPKWRDAVAEDLSTAANQSFTSCLKLQATTETVHFQAARRGK